MRQSARASLSWYASLLCLTASTVPMPAFAQDTKPVEADVSQPNRVIDEIIVTAYKREQSANDVGLTINVLGNQQLQTQQIISLEDLAASVPGLTYAESEYNTPVYNLRGIGFYETSLAAYPTVTTYMDEAALPFQALTTLTLFDLERVEVLKGPQGTLFGSNATGGAINYIAAKPTEELAVGGSLTYGRFNTFNGQGYLSGPLSDSLRGRLAVNVTEGSGWQTSATREDDKNGAPDAVAGRLLLDYTPTDRLRLQLNVNGWRNRSEPPAPQFVAFIPFYPSTTSVPFIPNATDDNRVADWSTDTPPRANNRFFQTSLRADYDLTPDIVLTSLTNYITYSHSQTAGGDGLAAHRVDLTDSDGDIDSLSQELRLADNNSESFRWILGLNYAEDKVTESDFVRFEDSTAGSYRPGWRASAFDSRQKMKNYSAFASGEYDISYLTLKGGVRYTQADRSSENCYFLPESESVGGAPTPQQEFFAFLSTLFSGTPTPVPGFGECLTLDPATFKPGRFYGELNQDNLSWRVGIDWNPTESVLAYVNVAKGYKAGSFPTLSAATFTAYTPVVQEAVLSYEVGVKTEMFDRRLSANLALFYSDYKDKQEKSKLVDPVFGPLDALVNVPESSIKGVELDVQTRPLDGLTIGGSVVYLDATIDEFTGVNRPGVLDVYDDTPMPFTSKWELNGNVHYQFGLTDDMDGFAGGQVHYRSKANSSIGAPDLFALPSYTTVDLQAGIEWGDGRYRFMVWGKNVTDEFYVNNVVYYIDGISRWTGRPATYGVTMSFSH